MHQGILYLVPTPIDEESKLNPEAFNLLLKASEKSLLGSSGDSECLIVVEDLKPARKRWINFGLPREMIEKFYQLNEHNFKNSTTHLIAELKLGKNVYVMSDGGLPAFCDPGRELVYEAHKNKIKVTATPFFNSVILGLALSGLPHQHFFFQGFLPIDSLGRQKVLEGLITAKHTTILMDTPYRLKRLLEELIQLGPRFKKEVFLGLDLNCPTEELYLGKVNDIIHQIQDFKREFILVIS